jgi:cytochrome P450
MTTTLPRGPRRPSPIQLAQWTLRPTELLESCERRFGDAFTLRLPGFPPFVVVSTPDAVRDVFAGDPEIMLAGKANAILEPLLGSNSVLLLDGKRHLRERKLMMPPFHGERMRAYGNAMREIADRVIDELPLHTELPFATAMQEITLEVILRTIFGLEEGARKGRLRDVLLENMGAAMSPAMFLLSVFFPTRLGSMMRIGATPIELGPVDVSRFVPWRALARSARAMDELLFEEITKSRTADRREDVLAMLAAARDEAGVPMSDAELRDELLTLLLAGHETTATTLAWTAGRVLERPDVLAKLREEIASAGDASPDVIAQLPYLDATIKEALRLEPIVPMVVRYLPEPMRIGRLDLPADVYVAPSIYLAHRRRDVWGEDALEFRPERFLERKVSSHEYFPFGGGARRCLGMAFAMYESKIVFAQLVRRLDMRLAPGARPRRVRRGVTFAPEGGLPIVVDARDASRAPSRSTAPAAAE